MHLPASQGIVLNNRWSAGTPIWRPPHNGKVTVAFQDLDSCKLRKIKDIEGGPLVLGKLERYNVSLHLYFRYGLLSGTFPVSVWF